MTLMATADQSLKKKLKLTQRKITNCKLLFTANENAFTLSGQTAEKKGR